MTDATTALLVRALGFIERGWCRYALARDAAESGINPRHFKAVAWCALGALAAAGVELDNDCWQHPAARRLHAVIGGEDIYSFNDRQKNVEPVLAAFDRAIAAGQ